MLTIVSAAGKHDNNNSNNNKNIRLLIEKAANCEYGKVPCTMCVCFPPESTFRVLPIYKRCIRWNPAAMRGFANLT